MSVKKVISILLLVGGIAVLVLSATADVLKIGEYPHFGRVQIAGVVVGVVAVVISLVVMLRKKP